MYNCGSDCRPVEEAPHPAKEAEKQPNPPTVKEVLGDNMGEEAPWPAKEAEKQLTVKEVLEDNMGEEAQSLHVKVSTERVFY
jgi:hypothetical protein